MTEIPAVEAQSCVGEVECEAYRVKASCMNLTLCAHVYVHMSA